MQHVLAKYKCRMSMLHVQIYRDNPFKSGENPPKRRQNENIDPFRFGEMSPE
jgi:hypothetical protein